MQQKPRTRRLLSLCFRCFSCSITLRPGFFADVVVVCVGRCWPTEWTCPMARWGASCAAAPDRRCSPASWCVMQISTRPPASTCCTTPLITSSWLPQSWSVLCVTHRPGQNITFPLMAALHLTLSRELFQMPHEAMSQNSAEFASSDLALKNNIVTMNRN